MARPEPPHAAALNTTDKAGRRGGGSIARWVDYLFLLPKAYTSLYCFGYVTALGGLSLYML